MKTVTFVFLFIVILFRSDAQTFDEKLKVVKDYNNEIYAVNPLFDYSSIRLPGPTASNQTSDSLMAIRTEIPDIDVSVKPLAYLAEQNDNTYRGYLKGNTGQLNKLGLDAFYNYSVDNYFNVEAGFNYDSWNDSEKELKNIKDITGSLGIKYYLTDELYSKLGISGSHADYGIYSFDPISTPESLGSVMYNRFETSFVLQSFKAYKTSLNYNLSLDFKRTSLGNGFDHTENVFWLRGILAKGLNESLQLVLSGKSQLSNNELYHELSQHVLGIDIKFASSDIEGRIGGQLNSYNDQLSLFPTASIKYIWSKETIIALNLGQTIYSQGIGTLSAQNLYVNPFDLTSFYSALRSYELGVKTRLTKQIDLQFTAQYKQWTDAPNYVLGNSGATSDMRLFSVQNADFNLLSFSVDAGKKIGLSFKSGAILTYNHYMNQDVLLTHRPRMSASPYITYSVIDDRLNLTLKGLFQEGQHLNSLGGESVNGGVRKDISFEARFAILNRVSIYANADNILHDDYNVWSGYDVFGRNLSLGFLLKI